MKRILLFSTFVTTILIMAFKPDNYSKNDPMKHGPSHVEMRVTGGNYRLFVNRKEFFVKGAGCEFGPCHMIHQHGGNSIRTWRVDNGRETGREVLDRAWENNLMVMMGLDVAKERHGFDYSDEAAVVAQLERIKADILELKDHPALLGWGIGNELNLRYTNKKVWNAVNNIAKMIKEVDGNHVATTMLAGISAEDVEYIRENCPNLDFLSIQMYGDIINLKQRIKDAGYDGPYLVAEWGATGHWEVAETEWGSPIEQSSTEKAEAIRQRYEKAILSDSIYCLGSYVFLWGQKQERTPTWYGLYTEEGKKTEAINVMEFLWTGEWPVNMPPKIINVVIKDKGGRFDNVHLEAYNQYAASIELENPGNSHLNARAEIIPEPLELSDGGDFEQRPQSMDDLIISSSTSEVIFKSPAESGAYRLFIYVSDEHLNVGTINIPFLVP